MIVLATHDVLSLSEHIPAWIPSLFPSSFSFKVKEDLQSCKAVISEPTNTLQEMFVVSQGNDMRSLSQTLAIDIQ